MSNRLLLGLATLALYGCSDPTDISSRPGPVEGTYQQIRLDGQALPRQRGSYTIDSGYAVIRVGGFGTLNPGEIAFETHSFGRWQNSPCGDNGCHAALWIITASTLRRDTMFLDLSRWVSPGILTPAQNGHGAFMRGDTLTYFDPNGTRQFIRSR